MISKLDIVLIVQSRIAVLHHYVNAHFRSAVWLIVAVDLFAFLGLGIVTFGSWDEFRQVLIHHWEAPIENRFLFRFFIVFYMVVVMIELGILVDFSNFRL